MFPASLSNPQRSASYGHFHSTSPSKNRSTSFVNGSINENSEYFFQNPVSSTTGRMSKEEMKGMTKDVQRLQNQMSSLMKDENLIPNSHPFQGYKENHFFGKDLTNQLPKEDAKLGIQSFYTHRSTLGQSTFIPSSGLNNAEVYSTKNIFSMTLPTKHSLTLNSTRELKNSTISNSYENFDREMAIQKERMEQKTKITSLEFANQKLQRSLTSAERRLDTRDKEMAKMKQRIFLLESSKQEIDEKQRNWKGIISRLERELVDATTTKIGTDIQQIFQQKAAETEKLRQELRRKKELLETLEEHAKIDYKKIDEMICNYGNEKFQLLTEIKLLERGNKELAFLRQSEVTSLTEQLEGLREIIELQKIMSKASGQLEIHNQI